MHPSWKYWGLRVTYRKIADVLGVSREKVKKDAQRGKFDRKDFGSIYTYMRGVEDAQTSQEGIARGA